MGAENENEVCLRVTRAAARRKRAEVEAPGEPEVPAKRKRVVLGDITVQSNAPVPTCDLITPVKAKDCRKRRKKVTEVVKKDKRVVVGGDGCRDAVDPVSLICDEDAVDINSYLRSMEVQKKNRPLVDFIEVVQRDISASMRAVLVDWLVEVAEEYKLSSHTLYLTVSYIDRFLSCRYLHRNRLQLLGVACMSAAAKYEEISPPSTDDFCYITDNTYSKQEVSEMEVEVLKFLKWEMGSPTAKTFLWRFIKAGRNESDISPLQLEFLSSYLAELSLLDYGCVRFLPSVIAASAVFLARLTLNPGCNPWNSALRCCSSYDPSDLRDCINSMLQLQLNKKIPSLTAIRQKYKQHKFKSVGLLIPPSDIPSTYFEGVRCPK